MLSLPKVRCRVGALGLLLLIACQSASGQSAAPETRAESNLGVRDTGIFSDLDLQVQVPLPRGLVAERVHAAIDRARAQLVLYLDDWPLKAYPLGGASVLRVGSQTLRLRPGDSVELAPLLTGEHLHVFERRVELPPGDADDDGIPDPLDVLLGARKTVLNGDHYDGRYQELSYPHGDVPRTIGVCTDVVVRALRNAGIDLQRAVYEDIAAAARSYPMVQRRNASIDHRRVKSLLPYFLRHLEPHTVRLDDPADPLRAGDVVFMDTFPDRPGTEHVGVISDLFAPSGLPLVINNWTTGTVTTTMELLSWVPVTQRFRIPPRMHAEGPISIWTTQLLVVTAAGWDDKRARLTRYERALGKPWRMVGKPSDAWLGQTGYAWGSGVHGRGAPVGHRGPIKHEGDGKSPAGVFALGTVRGSAATLATQLPYTAIDAEQRCIDDPKSQYYAQAA